MLGKIEGRRISGWQDEMVGWHHNSKNMSLRKLLEIMKDRGAWHAAIHGVTKSWTWLSDWTISTKTPTLDILLYFSFLHSFFIFAFWLFDDSIDISSISETFFSCIQSTNKLIKYTFLFVFFYIYFLVLGFLSFYLYHPFVLAWCPLFH